MYTIKIARTRKFGKLSVYISTIEELCSEESAKGVARFLLFKNLWVV
jgi:hypothetical protein